MRNVSFSQMKPVLKFFIEAMFYGEHNLLPQVKFS